MKFFFFGCLFLFLSPVIASPVPPHLDAELERDERGWFLDNLENQSQFLQNQTSQTCESAYEHIFREDEVRFSLFYGYLDGAGTTSDGAYSRAMVEHLEKPCLTAQSKIQTCGFRNEKKPDGSYELKRTIRVGKKDKNIVVTVFAPAVTWKDGSNKSADEFYFEQKIRSKNVETAFYKSLRDSQVVFYSGHSRAGAGPGFDARVAVLKAWDKLTKKPLKTFLNHLADSRSQLQFLGMFACETEKYYEESILMAAPHLGVIVSQEPIHMAASEQSSLGALNSILTRACQKDFAQSMIAKKHPEQNALRVKNFFEYSRSTSDNTSLRQTPRAGAR